MRTFYPVYVRYALYMYNLPTEGKYSGAKLLKYKQIIFTFYWR